MESCRVGFHAGLRGDSGSLDSVVICMCHERRSSPAAAAAVVARATFDSFAAVAAESSFCLCSLTFGCSKDSKRSGQALSLKKHCSCWSWFESAISG